jgi:hypothetical protein
MIHITLPLQNLPSPSTASAGGSRSPIHMEECHRLHGGTLSLELHTPSLPMTHVQVGNRRSCVRS